MQLQLQQLSYVITCFMRHFSAKAVFFSLLALLISCKKCDATVLSRSLGKFGFGLMCIERNHSVEQKLKAVVSKQQQIHQFF